MTKDDNKYLKVLTKIEEITSDNFCHDLEFDAFKNRLNKKEKIMSEKLSKIYRLSHSWNHNNSCYGVHSDWRDEVNKTNL